MSKKPQRDVEEWAQAMEEAMAQITEEFLQKKMAQDEEDKPNA